ncbi:hypothetical protein BST34_11895 [Mycolicibacterium monacense DSM 44395]|uniref:Uncharacterized protein n=2 Tax=Mycobacteriaceae TaxID=1762 RepID=A0AAD1J1M9_MYCMB|nr:hypothetical protein [Mycolicibacterium monacense DSM 44395]ORB20471.1 hypothetical protein BST34_11895 [Mycolicibacterium monacense DSM 44395]QHP88092.1 hypothetical protein EWR22_23590 [Mycolicibacterium monacense DSM 44395]BBZ64533.1 hypothetical protein MMON_58340 [Mycolicibacterium monacense]
MYIGLPTATTLSTFAIVGATVLTAPVATAAPECVNTGPRTTQCETGGSTQIVTTPPETNNGWPYGGWGYGGLIIGFGI